MWKLVAFVAPLALDSFAIAAALGTRTLTKARRWQLSATFVAFEAGAPLIGLAAGAPLTRVVGSAADYLAAAVLAAVGCQMVFEDHAGEDPAGRLVGASGMTILLVGLSISLDELAIGFTLGLAGLPIPAVITAIAVQALVASQLGLALGARIGARWRDRAARLAGVILVGLAIVLVAEKVRR